MDNGLIILLTAMILLVILLYWNTRNQTSETDHQTEVHRLRADHETQPAAAATETLETIPDEDTVTEIPAPELEGAIHQAVPQKPDDLTKIEGIGPKIAGLLADGDIASFGVLAATELGRLEEILEAAGSRYRLADPTSWPDQASLAARDEWEKLVALQEKLSGGREEES